MSKERVSRLNVQSQLNRLQRQHTELAQRIQTIDSRMHLTADEQFQINELKKRKLATKDRISELNLEL